MLIVSFSGLDGCGKSTQVLRTCEYLSSRGYKVRHLVTQYISATGVFSRMRQRVRNLKNRVGRPAAPRRSSGPKVQTYAKGRSFDEDRRQTSVHLRRLLIYPIDCLALTARLFALRAAGYDAVVCDRYTYDKMLGLPKPNCLMSWLMCRLAPRPDFAFFLDTPPETAQARDLEHQTSYYTDKYDGYSQIVEMNCGLRRLQSTTIEETQQRIRNELDSVIDKSHTLATA